MEIFIGIKSLLRFLGLLQTNYPHKKLVQFLLIISYCCFSITTTFASFWFFFFEAKTFVERTGSYFIICGFSSAFGIYCVVLMKRTDILELITQLETKMNERNIIINK